MKLTAWQTSLQPVACLTERVNTLRSRQHGRHYANDIFKCIFVNENFIISIKFSLKLVPKGPINNIPALVQIVAWRRPGDKPLSEPMMVSLTTHICVTRPQWVNSDSPDPFNGSLANHGLKVKLVPVIVRRAGLLWSQQDFEWRWSVPLFKCLTVLEFSFILFDLCLLITFFNFIMNYVPIVTFWIFTYHKIWILSIMFCFIWSYWIIYFLACLEVSWRVVS